MKIELLWKYIEIEQFDFFFNNLIVGNGKIWTLNVFFKTLKEVPSFLEHSKFFIKITWTDNKFC